MLIFILNFPHCPNFLSFNMIKLRRRSAFGAKLLWFSVINAPRSTLWTRALLINIWEFWIGHVLWMHKHMITLSFNYMLLLLDHFNSLYVFFKLIIIILCLPTLLLEILLIHCSSLLIYRSNTLQLLLILRRKLWVIRVVGWYWITG